MPISSQEGKIIIREWLLQNPVNMMVDFGAGAGYYGKLIKEINPSARTWAIEAWTPYLDEFNLKGIYDDVIAGDIELVKWPDGDLAIFGDVLEHMPKPVALEILAAAQHRYKNIIISIPIGEHPQGAVGGNSFEEHKSTWDFLELYQILAEYKIKAHFPSMGIFIK